MRGGSSCDPEIGESLANLEHSGMHRYYRFKAEVQSRLNRTLHPALFSLGHGNHEGGVTVFQPAGFAVFHADGPFFPVADGLDPLGIHT